LSEYEPLDEHWPDPPPWDDEPAVPDGIAMLSQRNDLAAELRTTLDECYKAGQEHARAENAYRVARAKLTLKMREAGTPVTLIDKLVFNDEEVALLKLKADMADVSYRVALEALNVVKLLLRSAEEDVKRDYSSQQ
jgi:hypothetical protein